MKIYIQGLPSGYEVEHLARLFYPMAPLTLTPPDPEEDCLWAEKRADQLWALVRQGGQSCTCVSNELVAEKGRITIEEGLAWMILSRD